VKVSLIYISINDFTIIDFVIEYDEDLRKAREEVERLRSIPRRPSWKCKLCYKPNDIDIYECTDCFASQDGEIKYVPVPEYDMDNLHDEIDDS
jgi:hypothetical protein